MIVAKDVEEAVQDQDLEFAVEGPGETNRIRPGRLDADDHVAQAHVLALALEGENVGGLVLESVITIELAQERVTREHYRQLSGYLQGGGGPMEKVPNLLRGHGVPSLAIDDQHRERL